jgi:putative transposase
VLAVLAARLRAVTGCAIQQLDGVIRLFQPETVFKWHRELVRRKWSYRRKALGGRPRTAQDIERLIVRLVRENSDWGNGKIQGELLKLGYALDEETVANILKRYGIPPAPLRKRSSSWRRLMAHYQEQILACDFFTVETFFLKTLYVLVFIELGSRRVHFTGCTAHPNQHWVTQQARHLVWELEERDPGVRFLIHDNDVKFTASFDAVFQSEHIKVIPTPVRAPNANVFMERWVRTVREECLDKILIVNQAHLRRVLREYIDYYNAVRPHQGLGQRTPIPQMRFEADGIIRRRNVLGGYHPYLLS